MRSRARTIGNPDLLSSSGCIRKKIRLHACRDEQSSCLVRQDAEPIDWRDLRRARGRAVGLEESGASCARARGGLGNEEKSIAHGAEPDWVRTDRRPGQCKVR